MFRLGADTVASLAFHLGTLLVLVVLAALLMRTQPRWRFVAIALAGLGIALAALFIDPLASLTHALGLKWNWGGKLLSTLVILAVMRFSPASFGEMGVKAWDGRGWRGVLVCLGVMCALDWAVSFAFASGARTPSVEQLLFQATMPGLNEELIYRAVMAKAGVDTSKFEEVPVKFDIEGFSVPIYPDRNGERFIVEFKLTPVVPAPLQRPLSEY